jgi:Rrf2 family transcriptional regulator, iron-sulfur cluster assembly transcription factor
MLNQTATYAIRAMAFLASKGKGKPILARTIASEMNVPQNFLSKILNRLVREGMITSVRGLNGGFQLAKEPEQIPLLEIVSLFMDIDHYRDCFLGSRECVEHDPGHEKCAVHEKWVTVQRNFSQLLKNTTVDKVL